MAGKKNEIRQSSSHSFEYSHSKTIFTILALVILIGLGCWQLERRAWKEDLLQTIAERQAAPPVRHIQPGMTSNEYIDLDYRRAELTGLMDDSKIVYLGPLVYNNVTGYHQLTPMRLQDGKVILVNEGFVPDEWVNSPHSSSQSIRALSGTLRLPALPGYFTPKNSPDGNKFYWADLLAMGSKLGTPQLLPVVFELDKVSDGFPVGGQTQLTLPNDHLQYALFWFALALAMVVVYLVSSFKTHTRLVSGYTMEQANGHDFPRSDSDDPPSLW